MMELRIGHLSTFYHTAVLLMAGGELREELGADVDWRLFGTGPAIVNAFEKGELDIAYIGLPPAVIGIERGVPIRCVAGGHMEGTVVAGLGSFRDFSETHDLAEVLKQFRGHKIGVPGKGSIHDVIIKEYLDRFGLTGETEVINFPWADLVTEAYVKGQVSAAVGTPALAASIMRYGDGRLLVPPTTLWPHNPSYGILSSLHLLAEGREYLERFLIMHERATALLREDPARASRIISGYVGFIDEEFVRQVLAISPKYCAQLTEEYISCTMQFVIAMKKLGYIKRELIREEIFDDTLIKKIHPEKDHY